MRLTNHALAIALLAGSTLSAIPAIAQSQAPAGGEGGAGSAAPILPRSGSSGAEGSGGTTSGSSQAAPSQAQPSQDMGATTQQPQGSSGDNAPMNAEGQGSDQQLRQQGDSARQQQPAGQSGQTDGSSATTDTTQQNKGAQEQDPDQAATERPSSETTGSINISTEQRTEVRNILVQNKVEPVDIDVDVSVGIAVPETVELHPLPPRIVEIVPAYRGYEYFVLADGRIIIVEPASHKVVYILTG